MHIGIALKQSWTLARREVFVLATMALLVPGTVAVASERTVAICNASPVRIHLATGIRSSTQFSTSGWTTLRPGSCHEWQTSENSDFYYYGISTSKLTRWLRGGNPAKWKPKAIGLLTNRLCYDAYDNFAMPANGACSEEAPFNRVKIRGNDRTIPLYLPDYHELALRDAPEISRILTGRMVFEERLRQIPGRESYFQIGADVSETEDGLKIIRIYPGMPAEAEKLQINDVIVSLDDRPIITEDDLEKALEMDILRADPPIITVRRNGRQFKRSIIPLFYEFNHPEYDESEMGTAFGIAFVDGVFLGFGSQAGCGVLFGLKALAERSQRPDSAGEENKASYSACTDTLDRELSKRELLYEPITTAATWASIIIPGLPAGKLAKLTKAVPLAARSRRVVK